MRSRTWPQHSTRCRRYVQHNSAHTQKAGRHGHRQGSKIGTAGLAWPQCVSECHRGVWQRAARPRARTMNRRAGRAAATGPRFINSSGVALHGRHAWQLPGQSRHGPGAPGGSIVRALRASALPTTRREPASRCPSSGLRAARATTRHVGAPPPAQRPPHYLPARLAHERSLHSAPSYFGTRYLSP